MTYQKISSRQPYKKKGHKRSEMDLTMEIMEKIRLGKIKRLTVEERDKLDKEYQVGKYRPYNINIERIKQLEQETREEYSAVMKEAQSKRNINRRGSTCITKKSIQREEERIKHELENG